jgi:hypothetical protein
MVPSVVRKTFWFSALWRPGVGGWFGIIILREKLLVFYNIANIRLNDLDVSLLEMRKRRVRGGRRTFPNEFRT